MDLNLQNIHLYAWCLLLSVVTLAITDHEKLSYHNFFRGFDSWTFGITVLQLTAGLLVSRILKYADSLQKTVVASLRGPVLVVLGPLVPLQSRNDPLTLMSAVIVGSASAFFLSRGKPT